MPDTDLGRFPAVAVPVVLPHAVVTVDDRGHARIAVENIEHRAIDCPDGPVGLDELGAVLARIAEQVGGPVRVEVCEPDGSRYADILQPTPRPTEPEVDVAADTSTVPDRRIRGEGFLPGETVLIAAVVGVTTASEDGVAGLDKPPAPPGRAGKVVLLGSSSGTFARFDLPAESRKRGLRGRGWRR